MGTVPQDEQSGDTASVVEIRLDRIRVDGLGTRIMCPIRSYTILLKRHYTLKETGISITLLPEAKEDRNKGDNDDDNEEHRRSFRGGSAVEGKHRDFR